MTDDGVKALHDKWMKIMMDTQTLLKEGKVPVEGSTFAIMWMKAFTQDLEKLMKDD